MPISIAYNNFTSVNSLSTNIFLLNIPASTGDVILITIHSRVTNTPAPLTVQILGPPNPPTTLINEANAVYSDIVPQNVITSVYYAIAPADSVNYGVNVTTGTAREFVLGVTVLSGVDTNIAFTSATSIDTVGSTTVTTGNVATGDLIFDALTLVSANNTITPLPSATQVYQTSNTSGDIGNGSRDGLFDRTVTGTTTYTALFDLQYSTVSVGLFASVICVARDTEILMADGSIKKIQNVERGDLVAGDFEGSVNRVARVIETKMAGVTPVSIVKMARDSLGFDQPYQELVLSSGHPILYGERRYRAKCFRGIPGVKYYSRAKNTAAKLLPLNDDKNSYSLFNIQYEHDGYFVANGVVVDSVPVLSRTHPLPRELYFDPELYNVKTEYNKPALIKKL